MREHAGVSTFERLEALVSCDELYELGDAVPVTDPSAGGRPRLYPTYMWVLYDALVSVWESARRVEVELAHPLVWGELRRLIVKRFPDEPEAPDPVEVPRVCSRRRESSD